MNFEVNKSIIVAVRIYILFNTISPILGVGTNCKGNKSSPEVFVGNTVIIGKYETARNGRIYNAFRGIPYAEKPLRFKDPKPVKDMGKILCAHEFGNSCPQIDIVSRTFIGDEDCLFLNIYSPMAQQSPVQRELLPVMVWFLPGAFFWGTSDTYGAKYFMDEDVVLVTFNYRLGALGFLSTGDNLVPGNMGLKDQLVALKWIQKNIAFFGGHPNRVTLFGESAGAVSVHFHVLSFASRGLFHNAISQSGSANAAWAIQANPKAESKALGEFLQCPTELMSQTIECLRNKSALEIVVAVVTKFQKWSIFPGSTFAPVVEPNGTPNAFLTVHPDLLLKTGSFNRVPWIAGFIPNEGLLFTNQIFEDSNLQRDLSEKWNSLLPYLLDFREYLYDESMSEKLNKISDKIRLFYLNKTSLIQENDFQNITNLLSDRYFIYPLDRAMRLHARWAPVYPYVFTYNDGDRTLHRALWKISTDYGSSHFDEIQFLFNGIYGAPEYLSETNANGTKSSQYEVSRSLVKLWTNFATYSVTIVPNGKRLVWDPIPERIRNEDIIQYLEISSSLQLSRFDLRDRMMFWETLSNDT